jgi:MFS transporter, MCT family, aspergillic acid transporter
MMASISTKYYQLLLSQGVCSALGICAIFQPCMSSIPSWFQRKRGAAYGIASSGTSLGGVIFPIMISQLIRRVGYAWSMRISAFLLLFLLTIVNLTVKSRVPSQRQKISRGTILQPFREVPMILLLLGFFFLTFGVFIPINYIIIQAIDDGMSNDLAQYLTALLNAAR